MAWTGLGPRHVLQAQRDIVAFVTAPHTPPRAAAEMIAVMRQAMGAEAAAAVLACLLLTATPYEVKKKAVDELLKRDDPHYVTAACEITVGGLDPNLTFLLQSRIVANGTARHDRELDRLFYVFGQEPYRRQIAASVLQGLAHRARKEADPDLAPCGLRRLGLALHEQRSPESESVFALAARSADVLISATSRHALALFALERGDTRQAVEHWTAATAMGHNASAVDLALFLWREAAEPEEARSILKPIIRLDALAAINYATLVLVEFPSQKEDALAALAHWATEGTGVAAAYLAAILADVPERSSEMKAWQRRARELGTTETVDTSERILIQYGWEAV